MKDIYRPNDEGATMCIVRWLMDTPAGWIGAYDRDALEYVKKLEAECDVLQEELRVLKLLE